MFLSTVTILVFLSLFALVIYRSFRNIDDLSTPLFAPTEVKFDQLKGVSVMRQGDRLSLKVNEPGYYEIEISELDLGFDCLVFTQPSYFSFDFLTFPSPVAITIRQIPDQAQTLTV